MRLLKLNDDNELSLTPNSINNNYKYAILSHIWGLEEETSKDPTTSTGKGKDGYKML
jgi:hypothetical protein